MNFVGVKAASMWYAKMNQKGDMCESGYSVDSINCDVQRNSSNLMSFNMYKLQI